MKKLLVAGALALAMSCGPNWIVPEGPGDLTPDVTIVVNEPPTEEPPVVPDGGTEEDPEDEDCSCGHEGHGKGFGHCKDQHRFHSNGHGNGHCKYDCE